MRRNDGYRPRATASDDEQYLAEVRKFAATATKAQLIIKKDELIEKIDNGEIGDDPETVRLARAVIRILDKEMVVRYETRTLQRRSRG